LASLTWLGHASFRLDTDDGKRIYIDPFLKDNPSTPDAEREPERVDVIALTHGHGDHAADVVDIS
jgi:L-ascorbate metabolism protein UlaG (beta-lactamase superfamily)